MTPSETLWIAGLAVAAVGLCIAARAARTRRRFTAAASLLIAAVGLGTPAAVTLSKPGSGWWSITPTWALFELQAVGVGLPEPARRELTRARLVDARPWPITRWWLDRRSADMLAAGTPDQIALAVSVQHWLWTGPERQSELARAAIIGRPETRRRALDALRQRRADAHAVIGAARATLADPTAQGPLRRAALAAALAHASEAGPLAPTVERLLDDDDAQTRAAAAALWAALPIDPAARAATLARMFLRPGLTDADRESIGAALATLGPHAGAAAEPLQAAIAQAVFLTDSGLLRALGAAGPAARRAAPALRAIADDPAQDDRARTEARAALDAVTGAAPSMREALWRIALDKDPAQARSALRSLVRMNAVTPDDQPRLAALSRHPDPDVRSFVPVAVLGMPRPTPALVALIHERLADEADPPVAATLREAAFWLPRRHVE